VPKAGKGASYQRKLKSAGAREQRISREGRDIGRIPRVARPARKHRCLASLETFCRTYFPATFALTFSKAHLRVIEVLEAVIRQGGGFAVGMPRGSGKTKLCEAATLWAALNGVPYILFVGASEKKAEQSIATLKTWLETSVELAADFPEVCYPIAALEGEPRRCAGQLHHGRRTHMQWGDGVIVLPDIPGSKAAGCIIEAVGLESGFRGLNHQRRDGRSVRPELVIADDPQTDASARSPAQVVSRQRTLESGLQGLQGPTRPLATVVPCTVIEHDDLADRLLDREKSPQWSGERFRAMITMPERLDLWRGQYLELLRAATLRKDFGEVNAFYKRHRKQLDHGAEVYWPERIEPGCVSAVQSLMHIYLLRPQMFASEYQLEPLRDETEAKLLSAADLAARLSGLPRGRVPLYASHLTGFVDVQGEALWYVICAWGERMRGSVIAYGTWPGQADAYFSNRDIRETLSKRYPGHDQQARLRQGLIDLTNDLCGRTWLREDGAEMLLSRLLIDSNWNVSTEIVHEIARISPHKAIITPSAGVGITAAKSPMSTWKIRPGERRGLHWLLTSPKAARATRLLQIDVNYWKTFVADRLRTAPGDPGALTFYGQLDANADLHRMLIDHIRSERPTRTVGHGRRLDEWGGAAGRDNHWWDGLVGCAAAASMEGLTVWPTATSDEGSEFVDLARLWQVGSQPGSSAWG
jgi:hypothetical protein